MAKSKKTPKTPMAERRGLQGPFQVDLSLFVLLVRADIAKVADCFAREMKALRHMKDVARPDLPECDMSGSVYFPFQLRGHSWTTIIHQIDAGFRLPFMAKRLSAKLATRAIFAGDHDTGGSTDYIMFDSGKLAEAFHWSRWADLHILTPTEFAKLEKGGFGGVSHGYYAGSKARKLPMANFKALKQGVDFYEHVEALVDDFLKSQDAFLAFNVMDEPGREYFPLVEATDEDIIRIDVVET